MSAVDRPGLAQRSIDTPIGPLGFAVGTEGLCFVDTRPDPSQADEGASDDVRGMHPAVGSPVVDHRDDEQQVRKPTRYQ